MSNLTARMSPPLPFSYFEEISAVPRASGNEAGIADYLEKFAAEKGLSCYRDALHNVFLKKAGSAGREKEPAILLQAHTDMVAERVPSSTHDFLKEGIALVREGDVLRADGTTLGADDGTGVAMILSVLADDTLSHPPIEALFTASEEVGLVGACGFDYRRVSARRMINLDSDAEDEIVIGCCGGMRSDLSLPVTLSAASGETFRLTVGGLAGGHSGSDIDKNRLNANVLLGTLLADLCRHTPVRLVSFDGGDKDNAIPRDAAAVFCADGAQTRAWAAGAGELARSFLASTEDSALTVALTEEKAAEAMSEADTARLLSVLALPNGVLFRRTVPAPMPETSRNLARVRTKEENVGIVFSSRSFTEARLDGSAAELDALARGIGAGTRHYARYPGWESSADADVLQAWQRAYRGVTGHEARVVVIHAGLECGVITAALPGTSCISVGCNAHAIHTPAEWLELPSLARVYRTLCAVLKE